MTLSKHQRRSENDPKNKHLIDLTEPDSRLAHIYQERGTYSYFKEQPTACLHLVIDANRRPWATSLLRDLKKSTHSPVNDFSVVMFIFKGVLGIRKVLISSMISSVLAVCR